MRTVTFTEAQRQLIIAGEQTQTRRIHRPGKRSDWQVGREVQARTHLYKPETAFAVLRPTAVRVERVGSVNYDDARREGYGSVEEYLAAFYWLNSIPRSKRNGDTRVRVIDFEVVRVIEQPEPDITKAVSYGS